MRDPVLNALKSKLVTYESAGLDDLVKRVKARIAKLEKAAKVAEPEEAPTKPSAPVSKSEPSRLGAQSSSKKSKET